MQRYEMNTSVSHRRITSVLAVTIVLVGLLSGVSSGQGLVLNDAHDGQSFYGRNILGSLSSYQNDEDISVLVRGATDPNVYADPGFKIYGYYADSVLNLINTATVDANGVGGIGTASDGIYGYGMYSRYDATNSGDITLGLTGGTLTATDANLAPDVSGMGIYSVTGSIDNSGDVQVTAMGDTIETTDASAESNATAYGLFAYSPTTTMTNSGTVTTSVTGGQVTAGGAENTADSSAITIGIASGNSVDNSDAVNATAIGGTATAQGDATAGVVAMAVSGHGPIDNSGNLTLNATGGTATSSTGETYATVNTFGIATEAADKVNNIGDITIVAQGGTAEGGTRADAKLVASGIFSDVNEPDLANHGAISVTATGGTVEADDYGIAYLEAGGIFGPGSITNLGDIEVNAVGATAVNNAAADLNVGAAAWGLFSEDGTASNSGVLNVSVTGGQAGLTDHGNAAAVAYGIAAYEGVVNLADGTITVKAQGGSVNGVAYAPAYADARGIYTDELIHNAGTIDVNAIGGTATSSEATANADARAYGLYAEAAIVTNSGNITAHATAGEESTAYAYDIFMTEDGTLTNTGILRASGDEAYELYVASGTTTLDDTYNVTLDGDPNDASIGVGSGATLALNSATLTVTDVTGETRWDTPYQLFETDANDAVTGSFGDVDAVNPDTTAVYYDQGTAGAADDTVALTYDPQACEDSVSATVTRQIVYQNTDILNRRMTGVLLQNILSPAPSNWLADASSTTESMALAGSAPKKKTAGLFFEPYYSRLTQDAEPLGYNARLWGFAAGYEQAVENTVLGLHAGYGQSDIAYTGAGYAANSEDQAVLTAGFSGLTRRDPWTLRYGLTGFYGSHDYAGLTGLNNDEHETASYNSYGGAAQVMVGRAFRQDRNIFLPEVGLSYLWAHRDSYTTDATDPSWDTSYSDLDEHDLQAEAALRWLGHYSHDALQIIPSASIGVRHLLTGDETGISMSVPGAAPVLVRSERDRTALTLSGSMTLTQARRALSLAYDGEYTNSSERHTAWLRCTWKF